MVEIHGYRLFDTDLAVCGLAWSHGAIVRVLLSIQDSASAHRQLSPFGAEAPPPPFAKKAIKEIQYFLDEKPISLTSIPVNIDSLPPFTQTVLRTCRELAPGEICTYGELASAMDRPRSARAVGQALGRNPVPLIIPCHRVIAAGGKPGGFTAPTGIHLKRKLLSLEGILV